MNNREKLEDARSRVPDYTKWRNKKTSNVYIVWGHKINSTNEQDGQVMIEYELFHITNSDQIPDSRTAYVREINEFEKKFEKL